MLGDEYARYVLGEYELYYMLCCLSATHRGARQPILCRVPNDCPEYAMTVGLRGRIGTASTGPWICEISSGKDLADKGARTYHNATRVFAEVHRRWCLWSGTEYRTCS